MKKLILTSLLALPLVGWSQGASGEVSGTVYSSADHSILYGALVQTTSNGAIYRAKTDEYGKFRISAMPSGKYFFEIIYQGDTMRKIEAQVPLDDIAYIGDIEFLPTINGKVVNQDVVEVKAPIYRLKKGVTPEIVMTREDIAKSPAKFDAKSLIVSMTSEVRMADDGELVFRGARKGDMIYMMDGVKMTGISNVPSASIGAMKVYTGGIPAKYGDTNGGVVVMESLGYFDLYRSWLATQD